METAGRAGSQFLPGILVGMSTNGVGAAWVIKARSICGATLEESRIRLQVNMQKHFDHGILDTGVLGGGHRSTFAAAWMELTTAMSIKK